MYFALKDIDEKTKQRIVLGPFYDLEELKAPALSDQNLTVFKVSDGKPLFLVGNKKLNETDVLTLSGFILSFTLVLFYTAILTFINNTEFEKKHTGIAIWIVLHVIIVILCFVFLINRKIHPTKPKFIFIPLAILVPFITLPIFYIANWFEIKEWNKPFDWKNLVALVKGFFPKNK